VLASELLSSSRSGAVKAASIRVVSPGKQIEKVTGLPARQAGSGFRCS
jgi:hypothetical protein